MKFDARSSTSQKALQRLTAGLTTRATSRAAISRRVRDSRWLRGLQVVDTRCQAQAAPPQPLAEEQGSALVKHAGDLTGWQGASACAPGLQCQCELNLLSLFLHLLGVISSCLLRVLLDQAGIDCNLQKIANKWLNSSWNLRRRCSEWTSDRSGCVESPLVCNIEFGWGANRTHCSLHDGCLRAIHGGPRAPVYPARRGGGAHARRLARTADVAQPRSLQPRHTCRR